MKVSARAFSLVEVILAIGIASFCLLAILGLFSVAFQVGQQARDSMAVAGGSAGLMNEIRARTNFAFPATIYLDAQGQRMSNASNALYECVVSRTAVTSFADTGTNLGLVRMNFTWPASIPPAQRRNSNDVFASLP